MKQNQDDTEKTIKCIDAILEYLVKVYQHDINETPTADNANIYVSGKVNDLKGFDFEYAHNIAHDLGYVKYIEFDDGTINEFRIKPKGLLISLGGGHQKIRQKELKELEKLKWETNVSKWQSRLWWFPFLTGGLGLIFSIIALTTKESPKPDKKLIQDV